MGPIGKSDSEPPDPRVARLAKKALALSGQKLCSYLLRHHGSELTRFKVEYEETWGAIEKLMKELFQINDRYTIKRIDKYVNRMKRSFALGKN